MPLLLSHSRSPRLIVVLVVALLAGGLLSASAVADTTPASPGRVSGLVLDQYGQRLGGATIALTDMAGTPAGTTSTDSEGFWSLSVPEEEYDLAVNARRDDHHLSAKVRRYSVGADTKLNLILAGDPDDARVVAANAADTNWSESESPPPTFTRAAAMTPSSSGKVTFSGEVVDADGDTVGSGVSIWLVQSNAYLIADVMASEDGTFSLEAPPGSYTLRVATDVPEECPGCPYERTEQRAHTYFVNDFRLDGDREETIRLPRPAVVTVTVVDPSNRSIAGAWARNESDTWNQPPAIAAELFPGARPNVSSHVDVLTGTDGTADLEYIPGAGPATLSVDPPPGTQLPSSTTFPSNVASLKIQLQDGPTLHGRLQGINGAPLDVSDGYLLGEGGDWYPIGISNGRYAATAPAGSYRIVLRNGHNEEGESSDYLLWRLQSDPVQLDGDRALDLTVPFGYARLWAVDDQGDDLGEGGSGTEASSEFAIADGIRASAETNIYGTEADNFSIAVIGPSKTNNFHVDGADLKNGVYLAPGEDTVIAFIAGTGPGYDPLPTTTTTTTTSAPTTTTTSGSGPATSNDPPLGPGSHQPALTTATGYWALGSDGAVYNFGDAAALGHAINGAVDLEPTPTGKGYWTLNREGTVSGFGDAATLGDVDPSKLAKGEVPASLSATPSGEGYWVFTNRGRAITFGDAPHLGDMSSTKLNGPVLGSVAAPTGKGYYMVASDGGIFAFGDAAFAGSMGGTKLNAPVQALVPDADGTGYWLVASDGGIFAFDAPFRGSMGGTKLNKPVVGMVRYGDGYLMVGADGGIFNFSTSPFAGSLGDRPPTSPMVAIAALP